jgi:hypothetical protein
MALIWACWEWGRTVLSHRVCMMVPQCDPTHLAYNHRNDKYQTHVLVPFSAHGRIQQPLCLSRSCNAPIRNDTGRTFVIQSTSPQPMDTLNAPAAYPNSSLSVPLGLRAFSTALGTEFVFQSLDDPVDGIFEQPSDFILLNLHSSATYSTVFCYRMAFQEERGSAPRWTAQFRLQGSVNETWASAAGQYLP